MSEVNLWRAYCPICGAEGEVLVHFDGKYRDAKFAWDFKKKWWQFWCWHWYPKYEVKRRVQVPEGSIYVWDEKPCNS